MLIIKIVEESEKVPTDLSHKNKPYSEFYKKIALDTIRQTLESKSIYYYILEEGLSTSYVIRKEDEIYARRNLILTKLFLAKVAIESNEKWSTISVKVLEDVEPSFHVSIMKVALRNENPVQFLLDHQKHWSFRSEKVIRFLSQPENIGRPNDLSTLQKFVFKMSNFAKTRKG